LCLLLIKSLKLRKLGCLGSFFSDLKKVDGGAKAFGADLGLGILAATPCFPTLLMSFGCPVDGLPRVDPREDPKAGGLIGLGI
jgi:hypothetical protein